MRGWSRKKVAIELSRLFPGVAVTGKEIARWEFGKRTPSPYYREKLCILFDATADKLGFLKKNKDIKLLMPEPSILRQNEALPDELLCTDLEFRVQCVIYEALSQRISLNELQKRLTSILVLERSTIMDIERRKVLRRLALTPIQALGLSVLGTSRTFVPEDVLTHCAAGITSLGQLAWTFSTDKQYHKALEKAQLAEYLLKNTKDTIHPLIQSNTYAVLGAYSAQNRQRDESLTALNKATQMFLLTTPTDELSYADYDYSEIALTWGLAHMRTGYPEEAINSFVEVIDPITLQTKMPVSERARVEFLNHMALASVKRSTKDLEESVRYWQVGMQGAKSLKSEQRFSEAATAYEIMESVWPNEKQVTSLRELIVHW